MKFARLFVKMKLDGLGVDLVCVSVESNKKYIKILCRTLIEVPFLFIYLFFFAYSLLVVLHLV